jgi:hypothetical protein
MKFGIAFFAGLLVMALLAVWFYGTNERLLLVERCINEGGTYQYETNICEPPRSPEEKDQELALAIPELLKAATIALPDTDTVVELADGSAAITDGDDPGVVRVGTQFALVRRGDDRFVVTQLAFSSGTSTQTHLALFTVEEPLALTYRTAVPIEDAETFTLASRDPGIVEVDTGSPSGQLPRYIVLGNELVPITADTRITTALAEGVSISSPLLATGTAQGPWYFEGSFPIAVIASNGTVLAEVPATARGEWMTEDFVPFSVTIAFPPQEKGSIGAVRFTRDNPSGLPEHDAQVLVPVIFE